MGWVQLNTLTLVGSNFLQWDGCRPWLFNSVFASALAVQHLCAFEYTVQMNSSSWCGRMLKTEWSHDSFMKISWKCWDIKY